MAENAHIGSGASANSWARLARIVSASLTAAYFLFFFVGRPELGSFIWFGLLTISALAVTSFCGALSFVLVGLHQSKLAFASFALLVAFFVFLTDIQYNPESIPFREMLFNLLGLNSS